jgi:enoyl-CoA hydratase/carnithine racemase
MDGSTAINLPTDKILARSGDGVGWLTFNQPEKRNAISLSMWGGVSAAAEAFAADESVRVVVMQGAGGKAFAAGADISEFEANRNSAAAEDEYRRVGSAARLALQKMDKPIIAMVQGFCIGGGCAIAMLADLRVATPDSRFGIPAARLGVAYATESLARLVALVGPSVAKDIMFTARFLTAAEALAAGLINQVVEAEALESTVAGIARRIATNAPLTIRHARTAIDMLAGGPSPRDDARLDGLYRACFDSEDFREGRTAFMAKRPPMFRGK